MKEGTIEDGLERIAREAKEKLEQRGVLEELENVEIREKENHKILEALGWVYQGGYKLVLLSMAAITTVSIGLYSPVTNFLDERKLENDIEEYSLIIKQEPNNQSAKEFLSERYYEKGVRTYKSKKSHSLEDYENLLSDFTNALRLSPDNSILHSTIGYVYKVLDDSDMAISEYKKAIELDSTNKVAHNNLGVFYYKKEDYDKAVSEFEKAGSGINLGLACLKTGNEKRARYIFQYAKNAQAYLALSEMYASSAKWNRDYYNGMNTFNRIFLEGYLKDSMDLQEKSYEMWRKAHKLDPLVNLEPKLISPW